MGAGSVCVSWNCTSDTSWNTCALTCWWKLKRIGKNWEFLSFIGCTTKPCYVHFCPNSRSCLEMVSFWTWNPCFFSGKLKLSSVANRQKQGNHLCLNGRAKKNPLKTHFVTLPSQEENPQAVFWEPEFVGRKMDQIGGAVRREGGIWYGLEDPSFSSSLKCCWSWGGNICMNFQGLLP